MKARYLMTQEVVTARPETTVEEARSLLAEHHISGLPVLDAEGRVVGVFSATDALHKRGQTVGELMTTPAVTVDYESTMEEVAALLAAKNINRVPVLREGQLVGICSRADIVRFVATHHAWQQAVK